MRSVLVALAAGGSVGTVELASKSVADSITDVMLGQVLADQLSVAPQVECPHVAQKISEWSEGSMFSKPESVLLAVIDGVHGNGIALDSDCQVSKECIDGTCYGTPAACVAHSLVSQSKTTIAEDLVASNPEATVIGVASESRRGAAAGHGQSVVLSADMLSKTFVNLVLSGDKMPKNTKPFDLAKVSTALSPLSSLAQTVVKGTAVDVTFDDHSVTLDTKNKCVRLLFGETLAIAETQPASLVMLAPRSVACMNAEFGSESAEAQAASALIVKAVKAVAATLEAHTKQSFSAIVYLPTAADESSLIGASDSIVAPSLIEQHRRLNVVTAAAVGITAGTIANFHIFGWMTLIMILSGVAGAYSIFSMTSERDPLLYAKFRPEVDPTRRA